MAKQPTKKIVSVRIDEKPHYTVWADYRKIAVEGVDGVESTVEPVCIYSGHDAKAATEARDNARAEMMAAPKPSD